MRAARWRQLGADVNIYYRYNFYKGGSLGLPPLTDAEHCRCCGSIGVLQERQVEVHIVTDAVGEVGRAQELLSIGAVVAELRRSYPDVTHSSLRFLEREGFVSAVRTAGGHRPYTPHHVARIRQIKAWQAQRLSLEEIRQRLAAMDRLPAPELLAETFLRQSLAGELAAAYRTIVHADDVGMPLEQVFGEVLQPALTALGRGWAAGEVLVAQEKEVSELTREIVTELSLRHAPGEPRGPALVAACVEGERHEMGLRMICGLLRSEGRDVRFLGSDVAPRFLLEAVQLHRPAVILLSAKLQANLPAIKDAIDGLAAGLAPGSPPPILVGGRVAVEHADVIRHWGATPVTDEHVNAALGIVTSVLQESESHA
jgi:methanogenic corrinoid protein MtbC1